MDEDKGEYVYRDSWDLRRMHQEVINIIVLVPKQNETELGPIQECTNTNELNVFSGDREKKITNFFNSFFQCTCCTPKLHVHVIPY